MFEKIIETLALIVTILTPIFLVFILASMWSTERTKERVECYRSNPYSTWSEVCPPPGRFERMIRWLNGSTVENPP